MDAVSLHQSGRLEDALAAYEALLGDAPDSADALHLKGVALYQLGRLDDAAAAIEGALARHGDAGYWSNLGLVKHAQGDPEAARRAYEQALALDGEHRDAQNNLAKLLIQTGAHDEARVLLEQIVADDPAHFAAVNNLGLLHKQAGSLDAARAAFERCLAINPEYFDAWFNLGNTLVQADAAGEAVDAYARAVALAPDNAEVVRVQGATLTALGRFDEAETALMRALELAPDNARVNLSLGALLQDVGRLDDAEAAYTRVTQDAPEYADALSNRGTIEHRRGELVRAAELFQQALEQRPGAPPLLFNMATVALDLGRFDDAEQLLQAALNEDPAFAKAHECLVELAGQRGDFVAEKAALERWLEVLPDDPIARHQAAAQRGVDADLANASSEYVKEMFERSAEVFDQRLRRLQYRLPDLVPELVHGLAGEPEAALKILDAGCGTGLCGNGLRPWAKELVGIDLSAKMLSRARDLDVYDHLETADLMTHLEEHEVTYDAIVSMDVLIFFGDMRDVMSRFAGALRSGGMLLFSVEQAEVKEEDEATHPGYELAATGRFGHTRRHLEESLAHAALERVDIRPLILRTEKQRPVWGYVVQARKAR